MKKKTVIKSSLLYGSKEEIFNRLLEVETLQYIATPFARFISLDNDRKPKWQAGLTFSFYFYLFGFLPFGVHTIRVLSCDIDTGISTREHNRHVPVWNHRIYLQYVDDKTTRYTDEVEIEAGFKTPLVALWAKAFYTHRQRKWHNLLSTETRD